MKKLLLLFSLFTIISCNDKESPIGIWEDNIKLSQKEVEFDANENSVTITTEGEWWWITDVRFNGTYINLEDQDTNSDDFIIEETEFKIERKNATEIYITMSENTGDTERELGIELEAGDYFDHIKVTQSAN
ncbi:hypothetical protein SLH46_06105 [Draconibacterium sp. IB214405]|uniref:hypothetical protein n=1 Tax=Draconibacterium sp. IB214405 TaxID=3097352 RepID=UPI002A0C9925|nr:hypothetical protein [Draconibacterium sp. IB214405]MDX8338745.1 hypothetical protein [Draconibacterium sp. IB214405]